MLQQPSVPLQSRKQLAWCKRRGHPLRNLEPSNVHIAQILEQGYAVIALQFRQIAVRTAECIATSVDDGTVLARFFVPLAKRVVAVLVLYDKSLRGTCPLRSTHQNA